MNQIEKISDRSQSPRSPAQNGSSPVQLSPASREGLERSELQPEEVSQKPQESKDTSLPSKVTKTMIKAAAEGTSSASHRSENSAKEALSKKTLSSTPAVDSEAQEGQNQLKAGVPSVFNGTQHQIGYAAKQEPEEVPQSTADAEKDHEREPGTSQDDKSPSQRRSQRVRKKKVLPDQEKEAQGKCVTPNSVVPKSEALSRAQSVAKSQTGAAAGANDGNQENINIENIKVDKKIRTFKDCLQLFRSMHSFDWDQKDISGLKSSPWNTLTPEAFWFYCTALYFPFSSFAQSKQELQEAHAEVFQQLRESVPKGEQGDLEDLQLRKLFQSILSQDGRFRAIFKHYMQQSIEDGLKKKTESDSEPEEEKGSEANDEQGEEEPQPDQDEAKFSGMIRFIERELRSLEKENDAQIETCHHKLRKAFEEPADPVYEGNLGDYATYPEEFLAQVSKLYASDMAENFDWYLQNSNEILLNTVYPSKLEKEFLKHIELQQQKKNDLTYRKLLTEIEKSRKGCTAVSDVFQQEQQRLAAQRQIQIQNDDAQCAICNSGDYEDEDLIVFCGLCNVPVHQSCYGIDQIPENDWICYSCEVFSQVRGFCVECVMCSRKGGAMKPTNIMNAEYVEEHKKEENAKSAKKKKSKSHKSKTESSSMFAEYEDKTFSLHNVLVKEAQFQSDLRVEQTNDIELALKFEGQEKVNQIPDDYAVFFHRNEKVIQDGAKTTTKYRWCHLSCASWIPGMQVTPKTPIKFTQRMEKKRFDLRCIICLKKEGACIQCQHSKCQISFHIECARRSGYFMEIERRGEKGEKIHKIFCEKHRPLKIVKEMQERDSKILQDIFQFCRTIEKCLEIDQRVTLRSLQKEPRHNKKQEMQHAGGVNKKWREKDKKFLLDQVKYYFFQLRRLRLGVIKVHGKKRDKKAQKKQKALKFKIQTQKASLRSGLRSGNPEQEAPSHVSESNNVFDKEEIEAIQRLSQESPVKESQSKSKEAEETSQKQSQKSGENAPKEQEDVEMENSQHSEAKASNKEVKSNPADDEEEKAPESQRKSSMIENKESDEQLVLEALLSGEVSPRKQEEEEEDEGKFKVLNQPYPPMDWQLTLSQNDFPWYAVKFGHFSAKDCYEKYASLVKDYDSFFKKVLQSKVKYQKMLIQTAVPVIYTPYTVEDPEQKDEAEIYCYCKNENNQKDSIFVACDGTEQCENGAWIHHNCDDELLAMSKEALDKLEEFYCRDCRLRIADPEEYERIKRKEAMEVEEAKEEALAESEDEEGSEKPEQSDDEGEGSESEREEPPSEAESSKTVSEKMSEGSTVREESDQE